MLSVAIAQINLTVGDLKGNQEKILSNYIKAGDVDLVIFPELAITGYPPEDLVLRPKFQERAMQAVHDLAGFATEKAMLVGSIWWQAGSLYNAAFLLESGKIRHIFYKHDLPNYGVFDEKRVFAAGPLPQPFIYKDTALGVMICEDMWNAGVRAALQKSDLLIAINASPFEVNKNRQRYNNAREAALLANAPLVYVNQVGGQDELVFDGGNFVLNPHGNYSEIWPAWQEKTGIVKLNSTAKALEYNENEMIYNAMVVGLRDYVEKNNFPGVVLGLSGGMDSALSAVVAVESLGKARVHGVMLPSKFTSKASLDDAETLAKNLEIRYDTVPIEEVFAGVLRAFCGGFESVLQEFSGRFEGKNHDITEENMQSRIRGLLLMAISNKLGSMVLTTGNKSEMAVGYATLYGDMCGGFNVLKDIYKTQVYKVAEWRNNRDGVHKKIIPDSIFTKAPTAELRENQTDQDSLPPYDILDAILEGLIEEEASLEKLIAQGFEAETVKKVMRLVKNSEYKRRQAAPGVKITSRSFGRDRRYPVTNMFGE